ncbi:uncharacterized protein [Dysidea avara]
MVVTMLLSNSDNTEIECRTIKYCTPLYLAAGKGHNEVVKVLLLSNADVNCLCIDQCTPLHIAVEEGHLMVVKTLLEFSVKLDCVDVNNITPLQIAVENEQSDIVKCLVEDGNVDLTKFDQNFQEQVADLLQFQAVLEKSKTEVHKESPQMHSRSATHTSVAIPKSIFHQHLSSYTENMTLEEVNKGYIDGSLPIVDPRVVLLGCEGSGKTSLIDTFVGKSFQDTPATEGADQMEISVTTAANWELMDEKQKIYDLKKQMLLESEFFLSIRECCRSLDIPQSVSSTQPACIQPQCPVSPSTATVATPTPSMSSELSASSTKKGAMAESPKLLHAHAGQHHVFSSTKKKLAFISWKEFQELRAMTEKYDPKKKYIHLWDFAGQQIFQHTHGLFVSEEVVCLIVFNAGRSLYEVPGRRYPNDVTPAKSAIKVICYWMELISSRISRRSTDGDDLSILLPTFILVGTHIDELDPDIEKAAELAFQIIVPVLIKELASKPFARHIAGSKHNNLFAKDSSSIFFLSSKDEKRNSAVIYKLKRAVMRAASITRKVRPIRYVKMERKLMLLAFQDKMYVIDKSLAREVAESCGITCTDKKLVHMLHHFHQKGILLHFHSVPALSSMIILSPQWLAKLLTYVLTTLKCQLVGPPLALFVEKLEKTGLLEQELLEWSVQQFSKDEIARGHKMLDLPGLSVAELLINFKLMVDVSNTSLVGRKPRGPGKHLFLVPHLLPAEYLVYSTVFGYYFFYYFPAKFIPEHLVDQLIVKCAEWNGNKQYDMLKLTYQWVCMELGKRQIYELEPKFDHHVISLKIIPEPYLLPVEKERAFVDSNELVRLVQKFIDDLMRQHMTATFMKAPVVCYIPCSQCMKMHLKVDKATESSTIYCPVNRVHADITDYHRILTAHLKKPVKQSDQDPTIVAPLALSNLQEPLKSLNDHNLLSTSNEQVLKNANASQQVFTESVDNLQCSSDQLVQTTTVTTLPPRITEQVPKMKILHKMVIPKISNEWKTVADFLELELSVVNNIQEKCINDSAKCCEEMLREWLMSDHGLQPKTWSALITSLKEIKQLSKVSKEIEQELKGEIHVCSASTKDSKGGEISSDHHYTATPGKYAKEDESSDRHPSATQCSKVSSNHTFNTDPDELKTLSADAHIHSTEDMHPPSDVMENQKDQFVLSSYNLSPNIHTTSKITEQEPKMKQLHKHVIPKVAADWRTVAEFLELETSTIDHVEERFRSDPTRCCGEVFRKWLKSEETLGPKTWSTLITTLREIDQLKTITEQISHDLKVYITTMNDEVQCKKTVSLDESSHDSPISERDHHIMQQCNASQDEQFMKHTKTKILSDTNLDNNEKSVKDETTHVIMDQKPKMKELNNIVVPKIAADWRRFADSLEFESWVIKTIDVKYRNYPEECCEEVLRDWLSLDHGVGPRTWSTLLRALKETRGCAAVTELIETEINRLSF